MCKYLQNAPKTLANRREAPSCMPWLIAIVVSLFCCNWNCNSFVSIFPAHTHTHINVVTHMRVDCVALFMPFDVLWLLPLSLSLLPQFSLHTHTHSHAQWVFYYYYPVISVVATLSATLLLPLCGSIRTAVYHCWGLRQKSYTTYVCMCVQMYMTDSIIFLCSSYRLTPNILLIW